MNYWAILTGIDHYQNLPSLKYAQQDAVALRQFLHQTGGFTSERCLLFGDAAPLQQPSIPLQPAYSQTWRDRLAHICQQQVQPEDVLWIFFSGYGIQFEGQDYLVPVDGDPNQLSETGISVAWLYRQLKLSPTENIVVMLDVNRGLADTDYPPIGSQINELAKDFAIATLMAGQSTEPTHETLALQQGLFAAGVLEALQHKGCVTLGQIADYVGDRLPELCRHYCRPLQHPLELIPRDRQFLMLVSPASVTRLPVADNRPPVASATTLDDSGLDTLVVSKPKFDAQPADIASAIAPQETETQAPTKVIPNSAPAPGIRWDVLVAGLGLGLLISWLGINRFFTWPDFELSRFVEELFAGGTTDSQVDSDSADSPDRTAGDSTSPEASSTAPADSSAERNTLEESAPRTGSSTDSVDAMRPTPDNLQGEATDETAIASDPATSSYPLFARPVSPMATEAPLALGMAQAAVNDGRFADALTWLNQVPFEAQTVDYQRLSDQVEQQLYEQTVNNQAVLAAAQAQASSDQVAGLNQAIFQAQQIRPGEAGYNQAQKTIYDWSRQILALAEAAAAQGELGNAIAIADFVPRVQSTVYAQAQAQAMSWQQRLAYRQIIEQAQGSVQTGQAESLQQAIVQVQAIPQGSPEFEQARSRIEQWSEQILAIAQAQAAQGELQAAIETAQLIPDNAAIAARAQALIQQWRSQ